jgi:dTDP-4-amino-4,6-dideoxygalactose transaminase
MRRLAVDGAPPAFAEPRHVGAPNVANKARFLELAADAFDRGRLTNRGPYVDTFEAEVARLSGVDHCVSVCNATAGLQVLLRTVGAQDEVIVPSHTFVATAHAVRWLGMRPVFADVSRATHCLDPASVERAVTSRTSAILGVHLWGRVGDVDGLQRIADDHAIPLLFDAAHALGSRRQNVPITALGAASVVSFHATKFLNSFEGGAILTDDAALAAEARAMTNFGFTGRDSVRSLGTNAKMSEISAAMGLTQLETIDQSLETNRLRMASYARQLRDLPGLTVLEDPTDQDSNGQYVVVEIDANAFGCTRDTLLAALEAERVMARRYFWPGAHRMEPHRSEQPDVGRLLPVTEHIASMVLVLPTGPAMSLADVDLVCDIIGAIHKRAVAAPVPL